MEPHSIRPPDWHRPLAELIVLHHYLAEILQLQTIEPAVRTHRDAMEVIDSLLAQVQRHRGELSPLWQRVPTAARDLRAASSTFAGRLHRCLRKTRARRLPAILHDDEAILDLATGACARLHETALALGEATAARVALAQWRFFAGCANVLHALAPAPDGAGNRDRWRAPFDRLTA